MRDYEVSEVSLLHGMGVMGDLSQVTPLLKRRRAALLREWQKVEKYLQKSSRS